MKVRISADSTCDLTPELVAANDISIVPLYILCGDKVCLDGVDIFPDDVFNWSDENHRIVSTSAVNVEDYLGYFKKYKEDADALIHFTISSDMSSCCQNARIAASELENVYVIDSRNLSTGIGHLVLDAAEMARNGMEAEDIVKEIEARSAKLDVSFILDTLEYMRMGGRCSAVAAFGVNLFKLRPCIEVRGGTMDVGKKYRGTLEKCLVDYVHDKLADKDTINTRRIFITDSGVEEPIWRAVEKAVLECAPFEEVIHTRAGCSISGHCGPKCLGILFYRK